MKLKHPVVQGLEMLALGLTTSVLFYIIPYYYPSCKYVGSVLASTYSTPPSENSPCVCLSCVCAVYVCVGLSAKTWGNLP